MKSVLEEIHRRCGTLTDISRLPRIAPELIADGPFTLFAFQELEWLSAQNAILKIDPPINFRVRKREIAAFLRAYDNRQWDLIVESFERNATEFQQLLREKGILKDGQASH